MSENSPAAPVLPLVARASGGYCMRLLLVGLGMCAASAWFAFDAAVTYPAHNNQHLRLARFKEDCGAEASAKWPDFAKQNGYEPNFNAAENQQHTEMDILTQWIMGGATLAIGLASLGGWALARRRRVAWDGQALSDHRGVAIVRIEAVDDARWESKGVFVVRGWSADEKPVSIALDDWKMEPEAVEKIRGLVKARLA